MNKEYKESSAYGVDFLKNDGEKVIQITAYSDGAMVVLTNYGSLYEIEGNQAFRLNPTLEISE